VTGRHPDRILRTPGQAGDADPDQGDRHGHVATAVAEVAGPGHEAGMIAACDPSPPGLGGRRCPGPPVRHRRHRVRAGARRTSRAAPRSPFASTCPACPCCPACVRLWPSVSGRAARNGTMRSTPTCAGADVATDPMLVDPTSGGLLSCPNWSDYLSRVPEPPWLTSRFAGTPDRPGVGRGAVTRCSVSPLRTVIGIGEWMGPGGFRRLKTHRPSGQVGLIHTPRHTTVRSPAPARRELHSPRRPFPTCPGPWRDGCADRSPRSGGVGLCGAAAGIALAQRRLGPAGVQRRRLAPAAPLGGARRPGHRARPSPAGAFLYSLVLRDWVDRLQRPSAGAVICRLRAHRHHDARSRVTA
jgi:hypothetical protein